MKQTAVEWLVERLTETPYIEDFWGHVEQAKEMEKQQIIEAHGNKQRTKSNPNSIVTYGYTYTGEMYYNDKFKSE
jgi:hypothetical protein